jgi:hypothetical protein
MIYEPFCKAMVVFESDDEADAAVRRYDRAAIGGIFVRVSRCASGKILFSFFL